MNQKITESEVLEIRNIQQAFQNKIYELGQLYLQKIQAENAVKFIAEQESKLTDDWNEIQKLENALVDKLLSKYGQGSLDLKEGTFIPDQKT